MTDKWSDRCNDLNSLVPGMMDRVRNLQDRLQTAYGKRETRSLFLVFETWRSPQRQAFLLRSNKKVTRAGPWTSTHQIGMAVDFVPWGNGAWSWKNEEDWDFLDDAAAGCGLVRPIKWDRPHIEHPNAGHVLRELRTLAASTTVHPVTGQVYAGYDLETTWDEIA